MHLTAIVIATSDSMEILEDNFIPGAFDGKLIVLD